MLTWPGARLEPALRSSRPTKGIGLIGLGLSDYGNSGSILGVEFMVLTRQELFDLVWSVPMRTLALQYGISDVALKKRCKRHGVPTPGVGYWARVGAGQKPKRPTLPKAPSQHLERIVFKPGIPVKPPVAREDIPTISIPTRVVSPHDATLWAEERLKQAKLDAYGRLEVGGNYSPDLCVRPETVQRAVLILDTIAKALSVRGLEVVVAPYHERSAPVVVVQSSGERLVLQVEERLTRKPHVVTPAEEKAAAQPWGRKPVKWDYVPEGRLSVRLFHTHYLFRGHARWTETKTTPLEQQLGKVVVGIEAAVAAHKNVRAEEDRQKAQRLADERARLRPERLRWYQAWMAKELDDHAAAWARARQVREFLDAYQAVKKPAGAASDWLAAARQYADRIDPLTSGATIQNEMEPSDGALEQLIEQERARQTRPR
jgi:hypothetical protein